MTETGIGAPLLRKEDKRLLTGRGRYSGDIPASGELTAVFRRSDIAHGVIKRMDATAARAMPGVVAVFTADDLFDGAHRAIGTKFELFDGDGKPIPYLPRPVLCHDKVRMAGDLLALVIAETDAQARDAAEAIEIDIEALPASGTINAALEEGASPVWDQCPGNIAFRWHGGDQQAVEAAMKAATHRVELELVNNKITANPMEPRCALAIPGADNKLRLVMGNQAPHLLRTLLSGLLTMPEQDITVVSQDMGGGFGMRTSPYGEEVALCQAAMKVGRPLRWTATRNEAVVGDIAARGQETRACLALDADGRILGLQVHTRSDIGCYTTGFGPGVAVLLYAPLIPNIYHLPCLFTEVDAVLTNTSPTAPYRGAGRPEAVYLMERLMDEAAAQLGIDPLEIRRRNLIGTDALPYTTPTGLTYDSGDFLGITNEALALSDQTGFAVRAAQSQARNRRRGFGFATFVETSAMAAPGVFEVAHVRFHPGGTAVVAVGTHSHGQGHATVFAQIAGDRLGLPADQVEIVYGDTSQSPYGLGTYASRSTALAGPAILMAADKVIEKGRRIAAHMLEASLEDIAFQDGSFSVAGTDRILSWKQVAAAAYVPVNFAQADLEPGLEEQAFYVPSGGTFPNGCHAAEVEVDPETGHWTLERYIAVDDVGTVMNPILLAGQIHGGIAQGVGQAKLEHAVFDPETAQPLAGTFMDYAMPRADDLPSFERADRPDPCRNNVLGVKGAGELGTIGAPPVIMHALLDALRPLGVTKLDMPATPHAVWRAIRDAA